MSRPSTTAVTLGDLVHGQAHDCLRENPFRHLVDLAVTLRPPVSGEQRRVTLARSPVMTFGATNPSPSADHPGNEPFEVRTFVAAQLGCDAGAIVLLAGPVDLQRAGMTASYARRPSSDVAAKVTISQERQNLGGYVRRLVTATWARGDLAQTDIGPDRLVAW